MYYLFELKSNKLGDHCIEYREVCVLSQTIHVFECKREFV